MGHQSLIHVSFLHLIGQRNDDSKKLPNKGWKKIGSATLSPDIRKNFQDENSDDFQSQRPSSSSSKQRSAPLPSRQLMQQQQVPNEPT